MTQTDLVTITEVYAHLNLNAGDSSYRTELNAFIAAANEVFKYWCGPIIPATFTETYETNGGDRITLRQCPVESVQTVTEYVGLTAYTLTNQPKGSTSSPFGYSLDIPEAGLLVRRNANGDITPFIGAEVVVTYTSGRPNVPADIKLAALEDIRGLWQQTQNIGRPQFGSLGATEDVWPNRTPIHLFPRIQAIVDGKMRVPGIA